MVNTKISWWRGSKKKRKSRTKKIRNISSCWKWLLSINLSNQPIQISTGYPTWRKNYNTIDQSLKCQNPLARSSHPKILCQIDSKVTGCSTPIDRTNKISNNLFTTIQPLPAAGKKWRWPSINISARWSHIRRKVYRSSRTKLKISGLMRKMDLFSSTEKLRKPSTVHMKVSSKIPSKLTASKTETSGLTNTNKSSKSPTCDQKKPTQCTPSNQNKLKNKSISHRSSSTRTKSKRPSQNSIKNHNQAIPAKNDKK